MSLERAEHLQPMLTVSLRTPRCAPSVKVENGAGLSIAENKATIFKVWVLVDRQSSRRENRQTLSVSSVQGR